MMAGSFSVLPVSEFSARLPIALVALLNVWLIYAVARRAFSSAGYGVAAALLLALTPAHFIMGRQATDYFLPLAFALGWLLCLWECQRRDSAGIAVGTGLVLGLGLFSYITSWMVMPLYLALTYLMLWRGGKSLRFMALVATGFALPLLPLAVWLTANPSMPGDVFTNYRVSTGLRLVERISLYWDYFNPSYLFFSGGSNMTWTTRRAGLFPLALAVLLPLGLWSIIGGWRAGVRPGSKSQAPSLEPIWIAGFLLAPLPIIAALPEAPQYATARHLLAVPFGVLVALSGIEWLMTAGSRSGQIVAMVLALSIPIQFVPFARDYFSDYRLRSAFWSDSMNMRGVVASVTALDAAMKVPGVFLNDEDLGEDKVVKWWFYLLTNGREDLWQETKYFSADRTPASGITRGSVLVVSDKSRLLPSLTTNGEWSVAATVTDVAGTPTARVLRRN